jgi:putative transposase
VKAKYGFMRDHLLEFRVCSMCRVLGVHRSGFYAWLQAPTSARDRDDARVLGLIKRSWLESGAVYGYRKVCTDLRDLGERCSRHRVARLMHGEGLKSQRGYGRRPSPRGGLPAAIAPNRLEQRFDVAAPDRQWVTDITYLRTHEGWLYLAVVLDLFSRQVVGWAMQGQMKTELVLQALTMAVWRRRPKPGLVLHSDQGTQFTSGDWQAYLREHGMECSMSRRGNCHDNAVAESFFQLLKRERVRNKIYLTREDGRADVFDYIEMFYNVKRRHSASGDLAPVEYERRFRQSGVLSV